MEALWEGGRRGAVSGFPHVLARCVLNTGETRESSRRIPVPKPSPDSAVSPLSCALFAPLTPLRGVLIRKDRFCLGPSPLHTNPSPPSQQEARFRKLTHTSQGQSLIHRSPCSHLIQIFCLFPWALTTGTHHGPMGRLSMDLTRYLCASAKPFPGH